jgi:hypothetical protein
VEGREGLATMQWVHARLKVSSCIALLALALQLVLTFGHVHVHGSADASVTIAAAGGAMPSPADNDAPDRADDQCALCALLHLAGAVVPSEPPALWAPVRRGEWLRAATSHFVSPAFDAAAFAARAPPVG